MQLFYSHASPYARKIRLLLRELKLESRIAEVLADPLANEPGFLALNPLGKIPCLVMEDGESLYDSDVIAQFLLELAGEHGLFLGGERRWHWEKLHSLGCGLMDSAVALRIEKTKPAEQQSPLWGERHRQALGRGLAYLEVEWPTVPPGVHMIALVAACVLAYLDFRHPDIAWRDGCPRLAAWFAEFSARPSFQDTRPA
ncbi:MAG: glutathione S-transferase family protein [Gammaproteobacteria bacterium]|nr:glutathione S-transferase family protein [Gammaproteobacteria bacterium]